METNRAKDIIVEILQTALTNKVKIGEIVNPQAIAEAIALRVEFEKSIDTVKPDKIIESILAGIEFHKADTNKELSNLHSDEKLLANFAHGKLAAYNEIQDILTIKFIKP